MKIQHRQSHGLENESVSSSKENYLLATLFITMLLSVVIAKGQDVDSTPRFEMGSDAGISVGQASVGKNINYLLRVSDNDKGQLLTWSISSPPRLRTLIGFPAFALSGKVTITPDVTLRYKPTPGQTGNDEFSFEISDGSTSSIIIVHVSLMESEPPSNPGEIDEMKKPVLRS